MKSALRTALIAAALLFAAAQAHAQGLGAPSVPTNGQAILDLSGVLTGQPAQTANMSAYDINTGTCAGGNGNCVVTNYTTSFTVPSNATGLTTLTFAFRNDSGFFGFSDVSLTAVGSPSTNLVSNGNFAGGPSSVNLDTSSLSNQNASLCPTGTWCGFNQVAGISAGYVASNPQVAQPNGNGLSWASGNGSSYFWVDGATQQYDGIYQNVELVAGATYDVSFNLEDVTVNNSQYDGSGDAGLADSCGGTANYTTYSSVSTNGDSPNSNPSNGDTCGNAANVVAYVGFPGLPTPQPLSTPEPASLVLLGSGLLGLGMLRMRRR